MGDIVLLLGNSSPVEVHRPDADGVYGAHAKGEIVADWNGRGEHMVYAHEVADAPFSNVEIDESIPLVDVLTEIRHAWDYHSTKPAGYVTVVSDGGNAARAELIRQAYLQHFGITEPGPDVATALVTSAGIDFAAAQLSGTSASTPAKYVAVTANATAPSAADTTLTAEIATAGGGLLRAAGTYAHTTGTTTYTVTITLTANGSDSLPVTLGKAGIFTAVTVGTLVYEDLISPTITLSSSGDAATLTETVTL